MAPARTSLNMEYVTSFVAQAGEARESRMKGNRLSSLFMEMHRIGAFMRAKCELRAKDFPACAGMSWGPYSPASFRPSVARAEFRLPCGDTSQEEPTTPSCACCILSGM